HQRLDDVDVALPAVRQQLHLQTVVAEPDDIHRGQLLVQPGADSPGELGVGASGEDDDLSHGTTFAHPDSDPRPRGVRQPCRRLWAVTQTRTREFGPCCPYALRPHQVRALDALDEAVASGRRRCWVALPPGAGKTLVGLEVVRRLGNPAVVFVPNTAIQSQWCIESDAYQPDSAGTDRQLSSPVTVLTYQSLATFDTDEASAARDADGDTAGIVGGSGAADGDGLVDRLHPNGQAL